MRNRLLAVVILAVLGITGCGPSFDADLMVPFEARWMCDVQRSTYAELTDITRVFDDRLAGNGLTTEIYHDFKDALIDDIELRNLVLAEYQAYCTG
jgi:hypothetical protein